MSTKDTSHANAAKIHALARAKERWGLKLSDEDYRWFCNRCRSSRGKFVGIQEGGNEIWWIGFHKEIYLVAFSRALNAIVTFLPKYAAIDVIQTKPLEKAGGQ